jgi:tellurite resistance protein TehA-like permease
MKSAFETLIKKWIAQKIALELMALAGTLTTTAIYFRNHLLKYFEDPSGKLGLTTFIISIACILIALASYYWFKPKLAYSIKDGGCWLDEKPTSGIVYHAE